MNVTVWPGALEGEVVAPASKSEAHRLLICAALADDTTEISCSTTSKDIEATISCLLALGARIERTPSGFSVCPIPRDASGLYRARTGVTLDCGESGSTLRFMLPVVAALGCGATLMGTGRLPERPLSPLDSALVAHGATISSSHVPLEIKGTLTGGRFEVPGNVSSQYVTGLLLAAPLFGEDVEIYVSEPVESRPYIAITVAALDAFGVRVREGQTKTPSRSLVFSVDATEHLTSPREVTVGGDWSNAAFWLAAGALKDKGVGVRGLDPHSCQGDRSILGALTLLGADVRRTPAGASSRRGQPAPATLDVSSCPDLMPPLAAVAATTPGTTTIRGAARLRLKESDRLQTIAAAISALGGRARTTDDGLIIDGVDALVGGTVDAANDHRIAMMAAVMAQTSKAPVTIVGAECVAKSYPSFFEDLRALGGRLVKEDA